MARVDALFNPHPSPPNSDRVNAQTVITELSFKRSRQPNPIRYAISIDAPMKHPWILSIRYSIRPAKNEDKIFPKANMDMLSPRYI